MLTAAQIESYREIGYLVVPDVIGPDVLAKARAKLAELIEKSREVTASDAVYDLEDAHTPRNPRVRRIKDPHINGEVYNNLLRSPQIMDLVSQLIGPDLRMAVVASPAYLAAHPAPQTPQDLTLHRCVNQRMLASGQTYDWEFEQDGRAHDLIFHRHSLFA